MGLTDVFLTCQRFFLRRFFLVFSSYEATMDVLGLCVLLSVCFRNLAAWVIIFYIFQVTILYFFNFFLIGDITQAHNNLKVSLYEYFMF